MTSKMEMQREISEAFQREMEVVDEFVGGEGQRGRRKLREGGCHHIVKRMQNASNALHCDNNSMAQHIKRRN
jgi:hypothetical protein